jgi:hypothetical protein
MHALAVGVTGNLEPLPQSKKSIQISTSCNRSAIYTVGNKLPERVFLTSVDRTVTIEGENVGSIIDFNGSGDGKSIDFKFSPFRYVITGNNFDPKATHNNQLLITVSGKITSQSLSVQPGNTLNGSVTIRENIF